jgi:4-hydroxy-3-polyprenylbenzoate decarboxylase
MTADSGDVTADSGDMTADSGDMTADSGGVTADSGGVTADSGGVTPIIDLRSALERLKYFPGQLIETDHPVDPAGELAGVYKRVGAGGTVERPTRLGPAMIFNSVTGHPGARVLVGLMASRERVGILLDSPPQQLTQRMAQAYRNALGPVTVGSEQAVCQEVIYRAEDPGFDVRTILPAPTNTTRDAGPYFCLGLVLGSDPELGTDVTIHRLCVQGKDEISIFFAPGRHIDQFRKRAEAAGRPFPVSVNMGLDPAIHIGASFEAPTTPLGYNELAIAGGLRNTPVGLVDCVSIEQKAIARAEVVIEGHIVANRRVAEDQNTHTGHSMPEFPGYNGTANPALPVIKVTAITTRRNPILQTLVGPGEEHTNLAGIPTEASIFTALEAAMPGFVTEVYAHTAGGGKFLAILKCNKASALDDGRARQAALIALGVFSELKNIILVDADVDVFDTNDVLWAMQTRMQGDIDIITIPAVAGHVLDPSQSPDYNPSLPARGTTAKTIFDATVPFRLKDRFERAHFLDVDPRPFAPELNLTYPAP